MKKRDIFAELVEGFDATKAEKQGKLTLKTTKLKPKVTQPLTAARIVKIRKRLNMSQGVFAQVLRTKTKTLQNWEQGVAKPNAQATMLIRLVEKNPRTIEELKLLA